MLVSADVLKNLKEGDILKFRLAGSLSEGAGIYQYMIPLSLNDERFNGFLNGEYVSIELSSLDALEQVSIQQVINELNFRIAN